jgi:hypothetical protein
MKIMWFTLWIVPAGAGPPGVGVGVGVGEPAVRPTPPQPVRKENPNKARLDTRETFFREIIDSCLWACLECPRTDAVEQQLYSKL